MIIGERERQDQPRLELSADPFRFHARTREAENGNLGMVHDWRKGCASDAAEIRNGESAAFHVSQSYFLVARFLRELRQLDGKLDDIFLVYVANDGDQKAAIGIGRDSDINVLLVDDFFFLHIDGSVELGENLEGGGTDLQSYGSHSHLAAGLLGLGSETGAQLLEFGVVGAVVLGDVGNRVPGFGQVFRRFAANSADGDAFDFPPVGEIRQLGRNEVSGTRWSLRGGCRGRQSGFGVEFDVVFADASAGARALDFIDVDTDFTSQA